MRSRAQAAAALVEFALVWPIALLIVIAAVETAVWSSEAYAVRAASLAGARAGGVAGAAAGSASRVTIQTLSAGLIGVRAAAWCPGSRQTQPPLWVCAIDAGPTVEVDVGGSVPALVPIVAGAGLPVHAHVILQKEEFAS